MLGHSKARPFYDFQIQDKNGIEDRDQQQGDERGNPETANLRVAQRLPQRPPMYGEREQGQDGGADGDHNRPQTNDSRVQQRLLERFPFFVHFLDEIEEHDHVADDDANQTGDAQEGHKAKWSSHSIKGDQRANHALVTRNCRYQALRGGRTPSDVRSSGTL
jgi:hypothetical protein